MCVIRRVGEVAERKSAALPENLRGEKTENCFSAQRFFGVRKK